MLSMQSLSLKMLEILKEPDKVSLLEFNFFINTFIQRVDLMI
jgi:hypothetical protein